MLKHISIETYEDLYDFYNVKDFHYDKETKSYVLLSQNNELHSFARENIKEIIL
jgi:hypothetical protein